MKRILATTALAIAISLTAATLAPAETAPKTGYATVNGLKMYYEIRGAGQPLVLLHGGVGASEMFDPVRPALGEGRQLIAVHLQAHGRTADIDRPMRFELMADDVAALIKDLKIGKADVLGYSLGGGVALQTAIRHPDVVRKLVVISAPAKRQGWYPEVVTAIGQLGPQTAEAIKQGPVAKLYPDADWRALVTKLGDMLRQDYDWSKEVAAIKAPTMLVFPDADAIRPAHMVEFFGLLGGGQRDGGQDGSGKPKGRLAIIPDATHYDVLTYPALPAMVKAFLDAPAR
jgi:pimeloyl-ACP methyl ester carboxylesterase